MDRTQDDRNAPTSRSWLKRDLTVYAAVAAAHGAGSLLAYTVNRVTSQGDLKTAAGLRRFYIGDAATGPVTKQLSELYAHLTATTGTAVA